MIDSFNQKRMDRHGAVPAPNSSHTTVILHRTSHIRLSNGSDRVFESECVICQLLTVPLHHRLVSNKGLMAMAIIASVHSRLAYLY